jgi:hypothetical protein
MSEANFVKGPLQKLESSRGEFAFCVCSMQPEQELENCREHGEGESGDLKIEPITKCESARNCSVGRCRS